MQICDFSWVQHKPLETMTLNHFVPIRTKFYYFYPREKKKKTCWETEMREKHLFFQL